MSIAVVDASVLVGLLIGAPDTLMDELQDYDDLHAPAHVDLECVNALRGLLLGRAIDIDQFLERVLVVTQLPVTRHPLAPLMPRSAALAFNVSPYDGAYVALAEKLQADLVTRDRRLASVPGTRCRVRVV